MPTYLVHGFRWQRAMIRIHIIINDLEDAAAEWIMAPATSVTLLNSFYTNYDFLPPSSPPSASYPLPAPHTQVLINDDHGGRRTLTKKNSKSQSSMNSFGLRGRPETQSSNDSSLFPGTFGNGNGNGTQSLGRNAGRSAANSIRSASTMQKIEEKHQSFNDWSAIKLLEQYDPNNLDAVSQPYAYVGDHMVQVELGVSLNEEIAKYEARIKAEEGPLSPGSTTPPEGMSARDIRRKSKRLGWFEKLRDGLQKGADIGWYVVVVGDEERAAPESYGRGSLSTTSGEEMLAPPPIPALRKVPSSAKLRGFFSRKKSTPNLRRND